MFISDVLYILLTSVYSISLVASQYLALRFCTYEPNKESCELARGQGCMRGGEAGIRFFLWEMDRSRWSHFGNRCFFSTFISLCDLDRFAGFLLLLGDIFTMEWRDYHVDHEDPDEKQQLDDDDDDDAAADDDDLLVQQWWNRWCNNWSVGTMSDQEAPKAWGNGIQMGFCMLLKCRFRIGVPMMEAWR